MTPTTSPTLAAPTKDYRAPLRFWHWGNAALVILQLITILFQRFIVQAKSAVPEFQQLLSKDNIALTEKQGRQLAHVISERIWEWHIYFGLTLVGFWVLRIIIELRSPSPMKFSSRLMEVLRRYRLAPAAEKSEAGKVLFAKSTYALFYLFISIMAITGTILAYHNEVAFFDSIEHTAEEIHNVTMYLILGFVVLHVGGVVWAELTKEHGLISRMVGGEGPKA